jgi:hypothetical protein
VFRLIGSLAVALAALVTVTLPPVSTAAPPRTSSTYDKLLKDYQTKHTKFEIEIGKIADEFDALNQPAEGLKLREKPPSRTNARCR